MSDRVFALACVAACVFIVVQMWLLDVPIAYEPVGPKAFPVLLAFLMALCCVALFVSPDRSIRWPDSRLLVKGGLLVVLLFSYGSFFELLGFPIATLAMVVVASRLFGGRPIASVLAGVMIGVLGYLLFDRLLQVSLPLGRIWS